MDFIFVKSKNEKQLINDDLNYDETYYWSPGCFIKYNFGTQVHFEKSKGIALSGRILKSNSSNQDSLSCLLEDLIDRKWPISNDYTGAFSGILINENELVIFNDPIGIYKLFYYVSDDLVIVSTSLSNFAKVKDFSFNYSAWFLEMTQPEFSQYGTSTIFKDVFTLLPGECRYYLDGLHIRNLYDTTIKHEDKAANRKELALDLVNLINSEFDSFYSGFDTLTVPMSGGIDSRVVLAPFISKGKEIKLSNYGDIKSIDSRIAQSIAKRFKYNFELFDYYSGNFPSKEFLNEVIEKTDSVHVSAWFNHLEKQKANSGSKELFLLGDMCDILRSKGAESIKSRDFRKKYYSQNFFKREKIQLTEITEENKQKLKQNKKKKVFDNLRDLIREIQFLPISEEILFLEIEADMDQLFEHLEKYQPKYIESYEELFGIFTHGRKSMGKQLNLLKFGYLPEIPLLSLRIVRKVLNYSPAERYSDELTNEMFKVKTWRDLGSFRTSQNPFFKYNSSYYKMLLGWFIRTSMDQILTKMTLKGWINKPRLFTNLNNRLVYQYPGSYERFIQCLENNKLDVTKQVETFKGRRDGNLWPISSMDLMPFLQAIYYLNRFGDK